MQRLYASAEIQRQDSVIVVPSDKANSVRQPRTVNAWDGDADPLCSVNANGAERDNNGNNSSASASGSVLSVLASMLQRLWTTGSALNNASPSWLRLEQTVRVHALAFHATRRLLAIATATGVTHLYDHGVERFHDVTLRHDYQRRVSALVWRPHADELAVACQDGICLWRLVFDAEEVVYILDC